MAAVPRPGIFVRLVPVAARVHCLQGRDIYRINDLAETAKEWRKVTVRKWASSAHPSDLAPGDADGEMRSRGEKLRCGAATLNGCSGAAFGNQTKLGDVDWGMRSDWLLQFFVDPVALFDGPPNSQDCSYRSVWEARRVHPTRCWATWPYYGDFPPPGGFPAERGGVGSSRKSRHPP